MNRSVILWACAALAVAACSRVSDGVPVADPSQPAAVQATPTTVQSASPDPLPGVVPTTGAPPPAGPFCVPAVLPSLRTVARVTDPGAPTATVAVPDGWSMTSGTGDVGARLEGPDGMWAEVAITATSLDPEATFREYVDDLTAGSVMSTVSMLPADMCGFSGQRLMGMLSDGGDSIEYEDRLVQVPTGNGDHLIAIHVQAPSGAPGFADAAAHVTQDFEVGLP